MLHRRGFLQLCFGSAMGAALASCGSRARESDTTAGVTPIAAPARPLADAVILLYMNGGPSQLDTFDPKPGHANAAGVGALGPVSSLLPALAKRAGELAIIRSIVSKEGNHNRARHLMHTGYVPAGGVDHPAFGALMASEHAAGKLPGYVSIGGPGAGAGFLGAAYAPFPVGDPRKPVANLTRARGVDQARFDDRIALWRTLEDGFAADHPGELVANQRAVAERALSMMTAAETVAFDLDKETPATRKLYGDDRFAQGCLMARRLVEAGVPFVEVMQPGWDTHRDHAARMAPLCAELDRGMSALLDDLASRGMLERTLVVWAGDFGRTPVMNADGGRDHYPAVTPAVLAGGGVQGGQVIGATSAGGEEVVDRPLAVRDLFASVARATGLDPGKVRESRAGRPLKTVDDGTVIAELFG